MSDLQENELISAYLDGELSGEERARVEQLLATNADARQLVDELRALSTTLQSLPAQKVGESLSDRVMRIAERRTLAGSVVKTDEDTSADKEAHRPVRARTDWPRAFRRLAQPRTILWPAAAVAVAVVIMLSNRRGAEPQLEEVASAPRSGGATSSIVAVEGLPETPDEPTDRPDTERLADGGSTLPPASDVPSTESSSTPSQPVAESVADSRAEIGDRAQDEPSDSSPTMAADEEGLVIRCQVEELASAERMLAAAIAGHGGAASPSGGTEGKRDGADEATIETEITRGQLAAVLAELKSAPQSFLAVAEPAGLAPAAAEDHPGGQVAVRARTGAGGTTVSSGAGMGADSSGIRVRVRPDNPLGQPKPAPGELKPIRVRFVLERTLSTPDDSRGAAPGSK